MNPIQKNLSRHLREERKGEIIMTMENLKVNWNTVSIEGITGNEEVWAQATDEAGNEYMIIWEYIPQDDPDSEDMENIADWGNPVRIEER